MFMGLLTIEYEKKIEQNINFIAEFFTMKGFHSDTYKISLIRPNEKKNNISQYGFFMWYQGLNLVSLELFWNFGVKWGNWGNLLDLQGGQQLWTNFILARLCCVDLKNTQCIKFWTWSVNTCTVCD